MSYGIIALLLAGLLALHLWWRKKFRDITERLGKLQQAHDAIEKNASNAMAEKEAQQAALFNSMVEGVLVLDAAGKIQLVNKSLELLFGLTTDVRGQTVLEAFRLQELSQIVRSLPEREIVRGVELELAGMEERWLEVNATAIRPKAGAPAGALLVFHDLTRLKQLENTRREFVANVSHELRTPLSLIKGFVETLLDGAKNDPELTSRFLQTIEKHTNRLTFLIEDLLTISRLESGQMTLKLEPVNLYEVAQRVIDDLSLPAKEKKVTVENGIDADAIARGDTERLHQVFFNLLDNAIKYAFPGGRVIIGASVRRDGKVETFVADNGPGIPTEAKDRIFERFYRVDRARSRETGGTGLGLSIVKHIVHAHGGEVWLKSEPGAGATFYFTLPQQ